jgi:peptide/nickel transport system substrate-binding protein
MTSFIGKLALGAMLGSVLVMSVASAQTRGGTLRIYHRDSPPSASIHEEATISTAAPFMAVFNNLFVFNQHSEIASPDDIVPELATEWRWNEDNTKLTLRLREGVKWHDGKPFTSADVKCTWDTIRGERNAGWRKNVRRPWYFNLQDVTTNGDHEVTFHLGRPQPSFITFLATGMSPVYPCHVDGRTMRQRPIGTGPFRVVEFRPNSHIRLARNPDYWRPDRPFLDAIEWRIIPSRSTRILAFTAGEFDMTFPWDVTIPLVRDVRSQAPTAQCEVKPSNVAAQVLINREAEPFNKPEVRRAVALTLDRNAFNTILGEGQLALGGVMLPPPHGQWGLTAEDLAEAGVPGYGNNVEQNREEARRIMSGLGYGPNNPLRIKVSTRDIAIYRDPAVILIDHLKHAFIEAELEIHDTTVWYTVMGRRNFSLAMNLVGRAIDDPDVGFYESYACGSERNYENYCSEEMQRRFDAQSAELDPQKRLQLVREADLALQQDIARPMLYHTAAGTCWYPHVKGLTIGSNSIYNHWRMEDVWLDRR